MSVYENSRYVQVPAYRARNTVVLTLRERRKFNMDNASFYIVIQGDTLDYLADKFYGSSAYLWAILDANPSYQSELDMKAGDRIVIPAPEDVLGV